ncbi:MAG: MerR family transcriptional regulator [Polyangiaceae bacterium]|nr:MerR family transcriptional regulator [Polyangiaceae bacterium]
MTAAAAFGLGEVAAAGAGEAEAPATRAPASPRADAARFTIDELAASTGVPSRTIRFYQSSGALPPPRREGRVAYYDGAHVERLRLVAELQDRGLNLRAIRDLVGRADAGELSVSEWLGLGDQLRAPWTEDRPRLLGADELKAALGDGARPGLVAELVRLGFLRREGATSYVVESPTLLRMALEVDAAGLDLADAVHAIELLRKRFSRLAEELVEHFVKAARRGEVDPKRSARALETWRPIAGEAVRVLFAREMERALGELVQRSSSLPPTRRR